MNLHPALAPARPPRRPTAAAPGSNFIVVSLDGKVGWMVPGEIRIHEHPPFLPGREVPSITVVMEPLVAFGDLFHVLRLHFWNNLLLRAIVGAPKGVVVRADWVVCGSIEQYAAEWQSFGGDAGTWRNRPGATYIFALTAPYYERLQPMAIKVHA